MHHNDQPASRRALRAPGTIVLVLYFFFLCFLCLANLGLAIGDSSASTERTVVVEMKDTSTTTTRGWQAVKRGAALDDERVVFHIIFRSEKEGAVEEVARAVSDPDSPRYGHYLTRQQLRELVTPSEEVTAPVMEWLRHESQEDATLSWRLRGDHIRVEASVRTVERLFDTRMARYVRSGDRPRIAITQSASMPSSVARCVSSVRGLDNFFKMAKFGAYRPMISSRPVSGQHVGRVDFSGYVTPMYLRSHYGVPSSAAFHSSNTQGVAAFNDYYDSELLAIFEEYFNETSAPIRNVGSPSCLTGSSPCDSTESNLDVQYIRAMGTNVTTIFHHEATGFIYEWASDIISGDVETALVYSISYGYDEGLTQRAEQQLAALAALGITVVASAGDTGAAGIEGIVPINMTSWCFYGGCTHTTSACGQVIVSDGSTTLTIPLVRPDTLGYFDLNVLSQALNSWFQANPTCNLDLELDKYNSTYYLYSECGCSALTYGTYHGVTFTKFKDDPSKYETLATSYPACSEWVTAVGGTQMDESWETEIVASFELDAGITTGGGFSRIITRPSWQEAAVSAYLGNYSDLLPPSAYFNRNGRAIPDVTLLGFNYVILTSRESGGFSVVAGTSASSPSFAGMVALVNNERLARGLSPIGFLNPALYKIQAETPEAFIDITSGNNKATESFVSLYGYTAAPGWDPASGLGAVNFPVWFDALVSYNNSQTGGGGGGGGGSPTYSAASSSSGRAFWQALLEWFLLFWW